MSSTQPRKKRKRRAAKKDQDVPESDWYDVTDSDISDWETWTEKKIKKRRQRSYSSRHLPNEIEQSGGALLNAKPNAAAGEQDLFNVESVSDEDISDDPSNLEQSGPTSSRSTGTTAANGNAVDKPSVDTREVLQSPIPRLEEPTTNDGEVRRHAQSQDEGLKEPPPVFVDAANYEDDNHDVPSPNGHLDEPNVFFPPDPNEDDDNDEGGQSPNRYLEEHSLEEPPPVFRAAFEVPDPILEEEHDFIEDEIFPDNEEDYASMINSLGHLWVVATVSHNISVQGASYLWKIAFQWIGKIFEKKKVKTIQKKCPSFPICDEKSLTVNLLQ